MDFEIIKALVKSINEELSNNPLYDGYAKVEKIYREYETKDLDKNFISISIEELDTYEENKHDYSKTNIYFWCFFENELLADKFASMFLNRFKDFEIKVDDPTYKAYIRLINLKKIGGIDEYEKNLYCKKLQAVIKD